MELTFGEMLHIYMRRNKIRCDNIAKRVGVSRQMIVYYAGDYSLPDEEAKVKALAGVTEMTDVDAEEFLELYRRSREKKKVPVGMSKKKMWDLCVAQDEHIKQLENKIKRLKGGEF